MADRRATIRIDMNARKALKTMRDFAKRLGAMSRGARSSSRGFASMNKNSVSLGASLRAPLSGLLLFGAGALAVHKARRALEEATRQGELFANSMAVVRTITTQTDDEFRALTATTAAMAKRLGVDASDSARGLYEVISGGVTDLSDAQKLLEAATKLAVGGEADQAQITKLLTVIMKAYKLEVDQAESISDKLFTTVRLGIINMQQLSGSLGRVIGTAATAGVELEELLAIIAVLSQTLEPEQVMSALQAAILGIANATPEARAEMAKLGVVMSEDRLKAEGLLAILRDVARVADGSLEVTAALFPDREALRAIASLDASRLKDFSAAMLQMRDSAGTTNTAFGIMQDTMTGLRRQVQSTFRTIQIVVQTALEPVLRSLNNTLKDTGDRLLDWLVNQGGVEIVVRRSVDAVRLLVRASVLMTGALVTISLRLLDFQEVVGGVSDVVFLMRSEILELERASLRIDYTTEKLLGPLGDKKRIREIRLRLGEISVELRDMLSGAVDRKIGVEDTRVGLDQLAAGMAAVGAEVEKTLAAIASGVSDADLDEALLKLLAFRDALAGGTEGPQRRAGSAGGGPFADLFLTFGQFASSPEYRAFLAAQQKAMEGAQRARNVAQEVGSRLASGIAAGVASGKASIQELGDFIKTVLIQEILNRLLQATLTRVLDVIFPGTGSVAAAATGRAGQSASRASQRSIMPDVNVSFGPETVVELIRNSPTSRRVLFRRVIRPEAAAFARS